MRLLLSSLALLGASACRAAPPGAPLSAEAPRPWRLLERDGALVLEPDDPGARVVVELRFSRPEAATSEVVEAEIRLPGSVGRRRLLVRPDRPDVRILGPSEVPVDGEGPARVRFTCGTAGPGGIVVLVEEK